MPEAVIVIAKCSHEKKIFGMRFEKNEQNVWMATWAFPIKAGAAQREGYDQTKITGSFAFDPGYPGCPYCHAKSMFLCGCAKVACWEGENPFVTCPWCGSSGELSGRMTSLSAGGDL